jgi:hypothetical protein
MPPMTPFTTIEEAFEYVKSQPLTADKFEVAMSDGYTYEGRPDRPTGKFTLGMAFLVMHLLRYDLEPTDSEHLDGFTVFRFSRIRMTSAADVPFPDDFKPQRVRLKNAGALSAKPPAEIVAHFKQHPEDATDLIQECGDKRYMPSTFIEKVHSGYRVGWLSAARKHAVQTFKTREDAVTDYLLFSLGRSRWNGHSGAA